jgi:hypothetical protein
MSTATVETKTANKVQTYHGAQAQRIFAAFQATDETSARYALGNILCEIHQHGLLFCSTDGRRLVCQYVSHDLDVWNHEEPQRLMFPSKAVKRLKTADVCSIALDAHRLTLTISTKRKGDITLASTDEGCFPQIAPLIYSLPWTSTDELAFYRLNAEKFLDYYCPGPKSESTPRIAILGGHVTLGANPPLHVVAEPVSGPSGCELNREYFVELLRSLGDCDLLWIAHHEKASTFRVPLGDQLTKPAYPEIDESGFLAAIMPLISDNPRTRKPRK